MTDLVVAEEQLLERARSYLDAARAPATRRAYRSDWRGWETWARTHGACPLPASPSAVALYLTEIAIDHRVSTLRRILATLATLHRAAGFDAPGRSPEVREILRGIARTHGSAPRQVQPLLPEDLRVMFPPSAFPEPRFTRDRALLLLGWSIACRESELVALSCADLRAVPRGLEVTLVRSKTDQEGAGRLVAVPFGRWEATCPVLAWRAWQRLYESLRGLPIQDDLPAFVRLVDHHYSPEIGPRLRPRAVEDIVRRRTKAAHLVGRYGGHSLRAGYATTAAAAGVSDRHIMSVTGHRSRTTLDSYVRRGQLWDGVPQLL